MLELFTLHTSPMSLPQHQPLDFVGFAGHGVAADQSCAHFGVAGGGFELAGHAGEEFGEDELFFDADDGVEGAGHADVRLVGGAVVEEALVGRGDVGVGAEDCRDAAVEIPAESSFFAGGFGVEVEEDDFCVGVVVDLGEELVGFAEGVVGGGHEDSALKVDDGVLGAVA